MQRLEFEQLILEMVFEVGYDRLSPATVAYYLRMPIRVAEKHLDDLAREGVLEIECDDDGRVFYMLPTAVHPDKRMLDQTVMRRSARGLGSHFSVAELVHRNPDDESIPVADVIREAQEREQQGSAAMPAPVSDEFPVADSDAHPMMWDDLDEAELSDETAIVPHEGAAEGDIAVLRGAPNPAVPMLLSFFWPGLGQIHNGQPGKGLLMFFSSAFLWLLFLGWVVTIYSVIDAGIIAGQRREEHIRRALTA